MKKIRAGVIGGAGYTGGELVRLLLNHDAVEIQFIQSRSQAGKPISSVHRDLLGVSDLVFTNDPTDWQKNPCDVVFLTLQHGETRPFLEKNSFDASVRLIDISSDLRLKASSTVSGREFIYGLPELQRDAIRESHSISNPGCFATAIQLSLLPLAKQKKLGRSTVFGITGATGAGQKLTDTSHFAFRANNIQAYKTLDHQHVGEIEQSLAMLQGNGEAKVNFVPLRGDFTRGIFITSVIDVPGMSVNQLKSLYQDFYESHPFVSVVDHAIDLKSVVNTNRAQIEIQHKDGTFAIHVVIDNLLKGASGQAVQNMNLMFGLPETQGLMLKGAAF